MSSIIPIPLLVFGFLVLVGTIAGVSWLHVRHGTRPDVDDTPIATSPWLRIPYLEAFFDLPRRLPGMYRPVGTLIGTMAMLLAGACFLWDASGWGILLAIISNYYAEQAMERALLKFRVPGLAYSVTLVVLGVLAALIHFALLMQRYLS